MIQMTSIILAAIAAALIAFIQSIIGNINFSDTVVLDPIETGTIGGAIKGGHSSFLAIRGIMKR